MRRTNLIWFALGAGITAVVSVTAQFLTSSPPANPKCLVIWEAYDVGSSDEKLVEQSSAFETGEMLRKCDAAAFEMVNLDEGFASVAQLPITNQNEPALECALRESAERRFRTSITNCVSANAPSN